MRILIIGGTGIISTGITRLLIARGDDVVLYNRGLRPSLAREDLGFRVTIPWVEGARRTIKWLEENGKLEKSEHFPFYDRIIEAWRQTIGNLTIQNISETTQPGS